MIRKILFICLFIGFANSAKAQLSDLHYLPPLKQGYNNDAIQQQAVYLSTPEPTSFRVNVYRGASNAIYAFFDISNVTPQVLALGNGDNNITLVDNDNTGIILDNSGLRFESPSGNRFYVNYRGNSNAQAASLTSKGRVAMGTHFKWGGVPNLGSHRSKSNTLGIMATEDNTTIDLFGYDPGCEFRVGSNRAGITTNTHQITLDANESFVYETYIGLTPTQAHEDGWIGASIVSDKDIVISNGSMNFGRQVGATNRDAGIDQPVPENVLGKEYVFVRGNGSTNGWTEFPLIIATADNTTIKVNGSDTPIATINNGEYFQIPSNMYSMNTVGANMHVLTSNDVYAYQCLAGSSAAYTTGLNFVAPVNCLLPDVMDNIPDIRNIAGTLATGGLTIIASVSTPDANITVTDGNGPVNLSDPSVVGFTDVPGPTAIPVWKTMFIPNLTGNVSVQSTGPMAVGFFGFNGAKGVAGYFSGFDTVPSVDLEIRGGTGCFVGSSIFEATGNFDAYQWYDEDGLIPGANSPGFAPGKAGVYYVQGTKGPCTYDSESVNALYCDPDVIINKTVDKPEIMEGENATFTIRVRNLGVGPLTNLLITDNIPAGLSLVSHHTITGIWSGNTWDIGTLLGGETAILELEVEADEIDTLPLLSLINTAINTQDQTDTNTTPDNPSARIVVHNDYDNDGIRDITDLDDDNDGIYDEDECETLSFNISNGSPHNSSLISVQNYLILDIFSLDNSFNLLINGTDVAGEIQFQAAPGNFARFFDGSGYGESGNPQIYQVTGSDGTPVLRVVIDQMGQFQLYGSRSSNGVLEPMNLTTPANTFSWDPTGNNTISVNQDVVGPTNMSGVLLTAGCDTDSDGIPDQLDLDSDDDGCSDANEYYKEETADGGDGGEYGTGAPAVDPTDGTVNAASYVKVFAPEILLGNTSTDLAGIDINNQPVALGDTFNYVLSFQNTGDDNATNYTISNTLPDNITIDNIDLSNAPGSATIDPNTNPLVFTVPDNLVQIGDPEYWITITVTLSNECSDFVDACSSEFENIAYSTYQGQLNGNTFTDDNGSNSITACPRTPEVASNSILSGLTDCSTARTATLCGADLLLTAGAGFSNYQWFLEQASAPDIEIISGSSNTLIVTDIGNYRVEKTGAGTCPDLVERITVVNFGSGQTDLIEEYFNQVNADTNPNNNLQGEVVTCATDGTSLTKIFLCGATAESTIQLSISATQTILWQKLDDPTCSTPINGCANKAGNCSWSNLSTDANYTVTESGEYKVIITYQNGCTSRSYFNVFKNELEPLVPSPKDILCNTPGNIRVTNVGAGYGYQLVNANDGSIVVPYSTNNGPNFDINTIGTYKVQITQLHPMDGSPEAGTPIAGACIFETEDIGIQELLFDINPTSTAADCNSLGTVSISALNALPNYSYELFADDGSDAGKQLVVNDNTHTFTGVLPGDYTVVVSTQDGCTLTRPVNVPNIPELTLGAITSENITCTPGIVNLTPDGGLPSPAYEMAIWSKDGTTAYTDDSSVPDSAYDTNASFLFGDTGNLNREGVYVFILRDGNGCFAKSDPVTVLDLGTVSITASNSQIVCADSATAILTISASGGNAPYHYSLDGGSNYQDNNIFVNQPAGFYTITVMDSSGVVGLGCVESIPHEITQPFRLTASATILEDASCNPTGALVKIINANGGQGPYEYSFNGSAFSGVDELNLLPGDHQFTVKDGLGCTYDMELTVPTSASDPSFSNTIDYNCDGEGTITITPSNTTDFTYTYTIDGNPNTPTDNNIFNDQAVGSHDISIGYSSSLTPGQSTLFFEDFGAGISTQIEEIGPGYCFEPQDGSEPDCNLGPAGILVNGEYTVTNFVTNPIPSWRSPIEQSGITDARFLAIDVSSTHAGTQSVLWSRDNIEVLPNRDITLSFLAYNLKTTSSLGTNPEVYIELLDSSGGVISTQNTAEIPKNIDANDWYSRQVTFNPGVHTNVSIVLRSASDSNDGNDLVLDDIQAIQQPEVCDKTDDFIVVVEDNKEFSATVLGTNDPSCNGGSDGSIRFEVMNFDPTEGFQYSIDGNTPITSMVAEVVTSSPLTVGSHSVLITKLPTTTACTTTITVTLDEPDVIVPSLVQTAPYTCFNTGGTLEASAIGGTPGYEYQLVNTAGLEIRPYQTNSTFLNVPDGDYLVRVQNAGINKCPISSTTTVTIAAPEPIDFDLSTVCYDGLNNGSITVTVNDGNGDYLFRIGGVTGIWEAPTPSTATSYIFTGLSEGNYSIEVSDALGCISTIKNIDIAPALKASITPVDVNCTDGSITVNAEGGDGNYVYAFVPTSDTLVDSDFGISNTHSVTNLTAGDYNVYVRDNGGVLPRCEYQDTVTIQNAPVLAFNAPPTNATCFGEFGSIAVTITSGRAPFTYQLIDTDNGTSDQTQTSVIGTTRTYFNLLPGNYDVIITDALGCSVDDLAIAITQPDELVADISGETPSACTGDINDFGFKFTNYPTTLGTIEFSDDGGTTWITDNSVPGTSDVLTGYLSGSTVYPAMRTADCEKTDFPPFVIPYPLDDLDISLSTIIIGCDELRVSVQGDEGSAPYEYAFSSGSFDPATATWITGGTIDIDGFTVPAGEGMYQWPNLTPGRTFVFYVRDSGGCVRQSNVNVNDITVNPMEITASFEPSCFGDSDGEITYTIVDEDGLIEPQMDWTLYDINDNVILTSGIVPYAATISIPNLDANEYYIIVTQIDGSNTPQCVSGSENLLLEELDAITATLNPIQNISCESPGIIRIENIDGGSGTFTYTVTGPSPFVTITGTTDNPIEIAANSPAGDYDVTISDEFGCSSPTYTETLSLSANPVIGSINIDNCGLSTTVTIHPSDPTLLYSIDGGTTYFDNVGIFNNVAAGTHNAVIKNSGGCIDSRSFVVEPGLQATARLTEDLGCGIGQEAEILIEVTAGSGNYEYEILDPLGVDVVTRTTLVGTTVTELITVSDTYTVNIYDITSNPVCNRPFTIFVDVVLVPEFNTDPKDVTCFGYDNGSITVTPVNNGNTPHSSYTLSPNVASFNGTTNSFENLPPDDYTITAIGSNGCPTTSPIIRINEPGEIIFDTPIVVDFQCTSGNSENNATISINTASIVGGSNTYVRYRFTEVTSGIVQEETASSYIFSDLDGGDVVVRVYDDNGCSSEVTVSVPAFDQMNTPTISVANAISCNAGEDIEIDVVGSLTNYLSNPGNYEFRMLPATTYQATGSFPGLQPDSYTFGVRNISTNCEILVKHIVEDPNTFELNVQKISDVLCFGDNGSIELNITDATYTGDYTWTIYDPLTTPTDRSDDTLVLAMTLGADPRAPIDLPGGDYIVEVTQDGLPNCGQFKAFSITAPSAVIGIDPIAIQHAGCAITNNQGSATIAPAGGQAPYDITITNTVTGIVYPSQMDVYSFDFQGLASGLYTVDIIDDLTCARSFVNYFEILQPDPIDGLLSATSLSCAGDTNAQVQFVLSIAPPRNVTANYTYTLNRYSDISKTTLLSSSAPQTSEIFNNQGAGFYSILVEDDINGCPYEDAIPVEIVDPTEVMSTIAITQSLTCLVDAELELSVEGGTGIYEWSTDGVNFIPMNGINGVDTHVFQNVTAGTYQYFIQDSNLCDALFPTNEIKIIAIEDLNFVSLTDSELSCNGGNTAVIEAKADGGLGNYQYALFSDIALTTEIRPNQTSGVFADLGAGSYYVHVTSDDCLFTSSEIIIEDPTLIEVTIIPTDITCTEANDGIIEINAIGGSGTFQYAISPNLDQFVESNIFENLTPGEYTILVQDSNGCPQFFTQTIEEPEQLLMNLTSTPEICAGEENGTITVEITAGTGTPPYSTAIDSNNDADFVEGRLTFSNVAGGDHWVYVKDANGCPISDLIRVDSGANLNATHEVIYECTGDTPTNRLVLVFEDDTVEIDVLSGIDTTDPNDLVTGVNFENLTPGDHYLYMLHANGCDETINFNVEDFAPLQISLGQVDLNEITATVEGGTDGEYTFYLDGQEKGDDNVFYITRTDTYEVRVVDENGCEAIAEFYIEFIDIEIPNFFTPDGDGQNDFWLPINISQFPDIFIKIYDRYGREIYKIEDTEIGWNGLYQDTDLPTGDYWYVIRLNGEEDEREFIGNFTLYR